MTSVDAIVVGQGLAGTLMSYVLYEQGKSFIVVDNNHKKCSSLVAAGMYNPMSFRRIIPTWRANDLHEGGPFEIYLRMQKLLDCKFVHPRNTVKLFANEQYSDDWDKKITEGNSWINKDVQEDLTPHLNAPSGYGVVEGGGYVDIPLMLSSWKSFLVSEGKFVEGEFDFHGKSIGGWESENVIACTGISGLPPEISPLKLIPNKGEVLELKINDFPRGYTINNGKWFLSISNGNFKIGSSYERGKTDLAVNDEVKGQLLAKLNEMVSQNHSIVKHEAGVRPTVPDRRPLVGSHPEVDHLWILNGLGARGVMVGPYSALQLYHHVFLNQPLDPELDLCRYYKRD